MYRVPSRRSKKLVTKKPTLTSVLDAIFIFIFFLLMTSAFIRVNEIASDAPILSQEPPPKDNRPPLALTVQISKDSLKVLTGVSTRTLLRTFPVEDFETFDYTEFHEFLISIKDNNKDERSVILEPSDEVEYNAIVETMDAVRMFKEGDPSVFKKNDQGVDEQVTDLFDKVVFGNVQG